LQQGGYLWNKAACFSKKTEKIIYSWTVKNRFTQFILYLHGFTGKRLPIFSREPENGVQKVLYWASLAGNLILLAETENSANGISWIILVIGSK